MGLALKLMYTKTVANSRSPEQSIKHKLHKNTKEGLVMENLWSAYLLSMAGVGESWTTLERLSGAQLKWAKKQGRKVE